MRRLGVSLGGIALLASLLYAAPQQAASVQDRTAGAPETGYAPSPAFPFGRPHPDVGRSPSSGCRAISQVYGRAARRGTG
jgi:hypothetical protein